MAAKKKTSSSSTMASNTAAAAGFAFANPKLTPDDFTGFSAADIKADADVKGAEHLEKFPASRKPEVLSLDQVIGKSATDAITATKSIVFHSVGDTGGIKEPSKQFAVADAMASDLAGKQYATGKPAFFYHLGDVVYYLGQERYYYDQFYDPYRDYDGPILGIPGNHDAMTSPSLGNKSLEGFLDNFCTKTPEHNPEAQGNSRTTMTQPGVYFTLNAPFVKIIGLYSNTSEGGTEGVISGPKVGNAQMTFLQQQLKAAADERAKVKNPDDYKALIIAVHHPPFTGSKDHIPSSNVLKDLDQACAAAKIMPDLVLSGHAHLYERYTRFVGNNQIPFVVAGMGGYFNLTGLKPGKQPPTPKPGTTLTDGSNNKVRLEAFDDETFGFLRLTVSATTLKSTFVTVDWKAAPKTNNIKETDPFTVDLKNHTVSKG